MARIHAEERTLRALTADVEHEIVERLVKALHPLRIYLFGSHAYGTADRDSDVDLLLVVGDDETAKRDLACQGLSSLSGICIPVDLIVCTQAELVKWADVPCNIIHTVVHKGRVIYDSHHGIGAGVAEKG